MSNRSILASGDGTRPSTSGGVDNMGAGESFTGKKTAAGKDVSGPAPEERMQENRSSVESSKHDDSAPFGLTEDLTPETNQEPGGIEPKHQPETREDAIRRAAYAAYERRGRGSGNELQDWLDAETELDRRAGVSKQ